MYLLDYLKRILTKNVLIALLIIDVLGFIFLGRQFPWYSYPISIVIGLLIASYQVYAETKVELEKLRDSTPRLKLFFIKDNSHTRVLRTTKIVPGSEPRFDDLIEKKRNELNRKWENYDPPIISESESLLISLAKPSKEAYDASVNAFLSKYRTYLHSVRQFHISDSTIRSFPIILKNEGSVPAEKVVVEILLPESHLIPDEEQLAWYYFDRDEMPDPPKEPVPKEGSSLKALTDSLTSFSHIASMDPLLNLNNDQEEESSGPIYDEKGNKIHYRTDQLIHNLFKDDFEPFLLSLREITQEVKLELRVRIHASNLPQPIEDILTVHVDLSETPPDQFFSS